MTQRFILVVLLAFSMSACIVERPPPSEVGAALSAGHNQTSGEQGAVFCSTEAAAVLRSSSDHGVTDDERLRVLARALALYRAATELWSDAITKNPSYEYRFGLADAWGSVIRISSLLHRLWADDYGPPSASERDAAMASAAAVRDSRETSHVASASMLVVDAATTELEIEYETWDDTHGVDGLLKRTTLGLVGPETLPYSISRYIEARATYLTRVPADAATIEDGGVPTPIRLSFEIAEAYFVYGHLDEAKLYFEQVVDRGCVGRAYRVRAIGGLLQIATHTQSIQDMRKWSSENVSTCANP